jgi:parallel beta-helix repeat protein
MAINIAVFIKTGNRIIWGVIMGINSFNLFEKRLVDKTFNVSRFYNFILILAILTISFIILSSVSLNSDNNIDFDLFSSFILKADAADIYVPDSYASIQAAVDAASTGDIIYVRAGTYDETVTISKSITIKGIGNPTVKGDGQDPVFTLNEHNVYIIGIKINGNSDTGIRITNRDCYISDCEIYNCENGIYCYKEYTTIIDRVTINNCNLHHNFLNGISGQYINDIKIEYCTITYQSEPTPFQPAGINLQFTDHGVIKNNNIYNIYYGIHLDHCTFLNIENNYLNENNYGIRLLSTNNDNNNIIKYSHISHCTDTGLDISGSNLNLIKFNKFIENTINIVAGGQNNEFFGNEFIKDPLSGNNVFDNSLLNKWYSSNLQYYWWNGLSSNRIIGNYWSDYTGSDGNNDGIGDSPYNIYSIINDNYPLIKGTGSESDLDPPTTSLSISGTLGANGWYTSDVEIILSAVDSKSGIDTAFYDISQDGGMPVDISSTDIPITIPLMANGIFDITYWSIDHSNNIEPYKSIQIKIDKTPPVANFEGNPLSGTLPLTVAFSDLSTGNPVSWSWDFGDGGTSTLQNPSYTYNSPGTYSVSLIVTDEAGNSNTITNTNYVTVYSDPIRNTRTEKTYTTIQAAINDADTIDGDTITVYSGTYYERITLNKALNIQGIDTGGGRPIVDGQNLGTIFSIEKAGCSISDINIRNAGNTNVFQCGFYIIYGSCTITNCDISYCYNGLLTPTGTVLNDINIISCNFNNNFNNGISLESSNCLIRNTIVEHNVGVGLVLDNCDHIEITESNFNYNNYGIVLFDSDYNNIRDNKIMYNTQEGLRLDYSISSYNIIAWNEIRHNKNYNINILNNAHDNEFYGNKIYDFIYKNAYDDGYLGSSLNSWYSSNSIHYIFDGETKFGQIGNYWGNLYANYDTDINGIGDTPYIVVSDKINDQFPMVEPDTIAPTTNTVIMGSFDGSVYTSPVTIELSAIDNLGGSGPKSLHSSLYKNGESVFDITLPYPVDYTITLPLIESEGVYKLDYYSDDNKGNSEILRSQIFTVDLPVSADFSGTPLSGNAPLTVSFTDKSIGSPLSWEWDFNNDGSIDSIEKDPIYVYNNPGVYSVRLKVTDTLTQNIITKNDYITVQQFNNIVLSADPGTILAGGDTSLITAQLYENGLPANIAGVEVTFSSDDPTMAYLPAVKTVLTDPTGKATILLTSTNKNGIVTVTATAGGYTSGTVNVNVAKWGTISGIVYDTSGKGIPSATVKLYNCIFESNSWKALSLVTIPENPQLTANGVTAPAGMYTFTRVPSGQYMVVAEKDGNGYYAIVNIDEYAYTANIIVHDPLPAPISFPQGTGAIAGYLRDNYNVPYPGIEVTLTGLGVPDTFTTATDGSFVFDNIPAGSYVLTSGVGNAFVDIDSGSESANIILGDLILSKISGIITDKNKNGIPGASVSLFIPGTDTQDILIKSTYADKNGYYVFDELIAGSYYVKAENGVHQYRTPLITWIVPGTYTANVAIPDYVYMAPAISNTISMKYTAVSQPEGIDCQIWVERAGDISVASSVRYTMTPSTEPGHSATPGQDYYSISDIVKFQPGESKKAFWVKIVDDGLIEDYEIFRVTLIDPTNTNIGGSSFTDCIIKAHVLNEV